MKTISEFTKGEKVITELMVNNVINGVANNGASYLSVTLQDNTGTIDAKVWSVSEQATSEIVAGNVGLVTGEIIEYKGFLQMKLIEFKLCDPSSIDKSKFVKHSEYGEEQLKKIIDKVVSDIKNPILKDITSVIISKAGMDYFEYPAATKNHHEYVAGLATHVYGMLRLGKAVCDIYPMLNSDLLYSGIILHDVGKLVELSGAIACEYTTIGKLLGHISIVQAMIAQTASDLGYENSEEAMLLRHMVLSHHGQYEYGSPVLPLIPEAEMLSYIDNMDARMNMLEKAMGSIDEGNFTPRIFSLENRAFYKTSIKKD